MFFILGCGSVVRGADAGFSCWGQFSPGCGGGRAGSVGRNGGLRHLCPGNVNGDVAPFVGSLFGHVEAGEKRLE